MLTTFAILALLAGPAAPVERNIPYVPGGGHAQQLDLYLPAAAFAWVKRHIAERGGDPGRVFLMGHSSGCFLVSMISTDPPAVEKMPEPGDPTFRIVAGFVRAGAPAARP